MLIPVQATLQAVLGGQLAFGIDIAAVARTVGDPTNRAGSLAASASIGVFSYLRLVQTSIEDMVYALGSFRIRQYFLGLDSAAVPFFPPTDPQGMTKLERMGVVATGRCRCC